MAKLFRDYSNSGFVHISRRNLCTCGRRCPDRDVVLMTRQGFFKGCDRFISVTGFGGVLVRGAWLDGIDGGGVYLRFP
jgi:hypothetical protein